MSPRKQLKEEIKKIDEELNMPYIIPWERTAERRGRRKGLEEGIEKGIEKGKKETALRMLDDGLSIEVISKYTGLPTQEIEKLMSFIQ